MYIYYKLYDFSCHFCHRDYHCHYQPPTFSPEIYCISTEKKKTSLIEARDKLLQNIVL